MSALRIGFISTRLSGTDGVSLKVEKWARVLHVTIHSIARQQLETRRGIRSTVIPNVHDFATPPLGIDDYNRDSRQTIGLAPEEPFILQPARVIARKGIELAVELTGRWRRSTSAACWQTRIPPQRWPRRTTGSPGSTSPWSAWKSCSQNGSKISNSFEGRFA